MKQFRNIIGGFLREDLLDREQGQRSYLVKVGDYDHPRSYYARITMQFRHEIWEGSDERISGISICAKGFDPLHISIRRGY